MTRVFNNILSRRSRLGPVPLRLGLHELQALRQVHLSQRHVDDHGAEAHQKQVSSPFTCRSTGIETLLSIGRQPVHL